MEAKELLSSIGELSGYRIAIDYTRYNSDLKRTVNSVPRCIERDLIGNRRTADTSYTATSCAI